MFGSTTLSGQSEEKKATRRAMFYSNLYTVVQRRMPVLAISRSSNTAGEVEPPESVPEGPIVPESPPPEYTSRPFEANHIFPPATTSLTKGSQELAGCSNSRVISVQELLERNEESPEGINWSLANQGMTSSR